MGIKMILVFGMMTTYFSCFCQSKKSVKFANEYAGVAHWNAGGAKIPLLKWGKEEIDYYIIGKFTYLNSSGWNKFLGEVSESTGLKFTETKMQKEAEIVIYFGSLKDYFNDLNINHGTINDLNFSNWTSRSYTPDYMLKNTSFCVDPNKISDNNYGKYLVCNQFLKSLGLLGSTDDEYSIFYTTLKGRNYMMSKTDKKFLQMHYNKGIKAGETEVVKRLLEDIDLDSLLK